jgi:hypothetical protein
MSNTDRITATESQEELPYCVELWSSDMPAKVERILARAINVELAHAIFRTARSEHPGQRVTVRKEEKVIADTGSVDRPTGR